MNMKELAEVAGVSCSAVSRYLNGGSLSQEKREQIKNAIDETGYEPDSVAQMLRTGNSDQVGLIVPKLDSDAVTRVTRGVSTALAEEGYLALLADTGNDPDKEIAYLKMFEKRQVAGIIMMGTILTPQHEALLQDFSIPVVVIGQQFRNVASVYHDDYGAAFDITSRILEKGLKKIGFIGVTEKDVAVGCQRRMGVESAMSRHGLDPASLTFITSDFTLESGRECMQSLLDSHADIDGLICATDRIAFGALEILRQNKVRVPQDISVAAFDDNWAGEHITPHLTTVHFYYKTSGEVAAQMLLELIRNRKKNGPVMQTMLGYTIMERDSL